MTTTDNRALGPRFWDPEQNSWVSRRVEQTPGMPPQQRVRPIWSVAVADVVDLTPNMRRVRFSSDVLASYEHEPAADFTLYFPGQPEPSRRHYTARSFDPLARLLDIDFVMHGDGPAVTWAAAAHAGVTLDVSGPLVRHDVDSAAEWHLFGGDESGIPAIFGLLESLPEDARALAFIEVMRPEEQQPLVTRASVDLRWLYRGEIAGEESALLVDAVAGADLPPGPGEAFLAGETGRMREVRKALLARGMDREQIFAMGYWRPGRVGGDETIRD